MSILPDESFFSYFSLGEFWMGVFLFIDDYLRMFYTVIIYYTLMFVNSITNAVVFDKNKICDEINKKHLTNAFRCGRIIKSRGRSSAG